MSAREHRDRLHERTELAPAPATAGEVVAAICHVSDLHVMDAASPMRFEWIETLAHDLRWRPLLHMHRPQETLVPWAVQAHVDELREHPASNSGAPLDLVISTGDNIDNAQRNELDAYLSLLAGGPVSLPPVGSAQDAHDRDPGAPWPYWCPDADVDDEWKPLGYPAVEDLFERACEPFTCGGLGQRWTSLPGNHDLLCQGTSFVNEALLAAAVGDRKALRPPPGFEPADPLALFVDEPEAFLGAGHRPVVPEPLRRGIDLAEWVAAHATAGAAGWSVVDHTTGRADTTIELGDVTVVLLDTNHPFGDYQGSIGRAQLTWLDEQLTEIDDAGRLAVIASHHGSTSLVNRRGCDPDRLLGPSLLHVAHRHPCVVLWLVGHRHIHRVVPRPGDSGGFWEVTTASIIDWPSERRLVELRRHPDGTIEIACTVHSHDALHGSLAWWHRSIAERFAGQQLRAAMAGADVDRDVRLFVRR